MIAILMLGARLEHESPLTSDGETGGSSDKLKAFQGAVRILQYGRRILTAPVFYG